MNFADFILILNFTDFSPFLLTECEIFSILVASFYYFLICSNYFSSMFSFLFYLSFYEFQLSTEIIGFDSNPKDERERINAPKSFASIKKKDFSKTAFKKRE